jgi:hypothetical protein
MLLPPVYTQSELGQNDKECLKGEQIAIFNSNAANLTVLTHHHKGSDFGIQNCRAGTS